MTFVQPYGKGPLRGINSATGTFTLLPRYLRPWAKNLAHSLKVRLSEILIRVWWFAYVLPVVSLVVPEALPSLVESESESIPLRIKGLLLLRSNQVRPRASTPRNLLH